MGICRKVVVRYLFTGVIIFFDFEFEIEGEIWKGWSLVDFGIVMFVIGLFFYLLLCLRIVLIVGLFVKKIL